MNAADMIVQLKSQLAGINDQLNALQTQAQSLKDQKTRIQADIADLQKYVAWKVANP